MMMIFPKIAHSSFIHIIIPYYIMMIFYVLIKWLVTGDRYFKEDNFILKFHRMWMRKLGIDWL